MGQFRVSAATHSGSVRDHNEDAYVSRPELGLWAVADGAGGHEGGEVASALIAEALNSIPPEIAADEVLAQVRLRIAETHSALKEQAARRGEDVLMASTVVILIIRDGFFACLWAGDSRGYLLRENELGRITRDHSLVQELVDAGHITEREAEGHPRANVITRAVGADPEVIELDKTTGPIGAGDCFLLCSDGLSKELSDHEIGDVLRAGAGNSAADALIDAALARRARDNVTAVVVEVLDDESD